MPPSNLAWRKEGLIFWDPIPDASAPARASAPAGQETEEGEGQGKEAKMCRVSGYRWVPRETDWKVDKIITVPVAVAVPADSTSGVNTQRRELSPESLVAAAIAAEYGVGRTREAMEVDV